MALPKLRVTIEVEIWPGANDENINEIKSVIQDRVAARNSHNLMSLMSDVESAVYDWDNYGMPKMEVVES